MRSTCEPFVCPPYLRLWFVYFPFCKQTDPYSLSLSRGCAVLYLSLPPFVYPNRGLIACCCCLCISHLIVHRYRKGTSLFLSHSHIVLFWLYLRRRCKDNRLGEKNQLKKRGDRDSPPTPPQTPLEVPFVLFLSFFLYRF